MIKYHKMMILINIKLRLLGINTKKILRMMILRNFHAKMI